MNPDLDKDFLRVKRLGKLPILLTPEIYERFFAEGAIRKKDLIAGETYLGICRNSDFARWDGERFIYTRYKFGAQFEESINHFEDDNGYDLFVPIKMIYK